jgi:hypothetical protein
MSNIQDIRAIHTPQRSYMWEVEVQGLSTGGLPEMSFYAKTVSIPQNAAEQIIINHKASKTHHAGRDAAAHSVTVSFWDDEAQTIAKYFDDWFRLMLDNSVGAGVSRDLYAATLIIKLKNADDTEVTSTITLTNVFITDIAEVALSFDTSEPVEHSITFSYDDKIIS